MYKKLFYLLLLSFCSFSHAPKTIKILYLGNSLTYVNNLPAIVEQLAKQDGVTIQSVSMTFPDYSLEDHWNGGKAEEEIQKGKYDFVIVQQGPSAAAESQVLLLDYAGRFAEVCKKSKSKMAVYMVWPSKARSFDHDGVIKSYTKASQQTGSLLCPAGLAWKYAWQSDESLPLYGTDNFHPSLTGSVLAALTVYGAITNKKDFNFITYDSCSWKKDITKDQWGVLVKAAEKALQ